ncbi:sulfurtransferase [Heyndrickxia vini]|uniref:Sulfurtransferase n=1 Tax=Heyndrickxia vini TaxID=1476025 RepID=A0ABX7E5Q1_9BACI|nr:sulfurtransferase [Heyndrickxia vini]QQZ11079.1 sulfurtransferase [Heyndrickxia vini]
MEYIVDLEWLKDNLYNKEMRIIDCRFSLSDPLAGECAYKKEHIPGAVYFDLEKDLSATPAEHGGRHPLPHTHSIKEKLELSGINEQSKIIVYDGGTGENASRFWWILNYLGNENVFILNGGYDAWKQANYPTDNIIPVFKRATFNVSCKQSMLATISDVKKAIQQGDVILIDSRAYNRFIGLEEPIDKKKGHIPSAINKVWTDGFKDGFWKSVDEQKKRFSEWNKSDSFIVYCGSGVTATPNIIALLEAGFTNVRLYAGSFSDWVSYGENPIETGE